MPFIQDNSSPNDSETGSGWTPVNSQQIIDDDTYAANLSSTYAEKPLSEQLEPIAVVGMGN